MSARRVTYVLSFDVAEGTSDADVRDLLNAACVQIEDGRNADDERVDVAAIRDLRVSPETVYALGSLLDVAGDGLPDAVLDRLLALVDVASNGAAL